MSNRSQVPGCFKYGCVGCLSIVAIGVILIFLASAIQLSSDTKEPQPEERTAEHTLPTLPETETPRVSRDEATIPEILPLPELDEFPDNRPVGQIILDLKMGDFTIEPGPADQPIRVEADFDAGSFELTESFESTPEGSWTYEVSFGSKQGLFGMIFGGGRHDVDNDVRIIIPRGHPVDIIAEVGTGQFEADLGGLEIRRVDFDLGVGDHFVEFRDPLPFPMESFEVDASAGDIEIRSLGDASPSKVKVGQSVGELFLDLKGTWRDDAEVEVDFGIGECRLWLPDDIHVDLEKASVTIGESVVDRPRTEDIPADAPTLKVDLKSNIGEIRVEY